MIFHCCRESSQSFLILQCSEREKKLYCEVDKQSIVNNTNELNVSIKSTNGKNHTDDVKFLSFNCRLCNQQTLLPFYDQKFKNLEEMTVKFCPLQRINDKNFNKLENLKRLNITECRLLSIPGKTFSKLGNLQSLDLSKNELNLLVENVFSDLKNLENLDLSGNRIRVLPQYLFHYNENLKTLSFKNNKLKIILNDFKSNSKLQQMNFEKNNCINTSFSNLNALQSTLQTTCNTTRSLVYEIMFDSDNVLQSKITRVEMDIQSMNHSYDNSSQGINAANLKKLLQDNGTIFDEIKSSKLERMKMNDTINLIGSSVAEKIDERCKIFNETIQYLDEKISDRISRFNDSFTILYTNLSMQIEKTETRCSSVASQSQELENLKVELLKMLNESNQKQLELERKLAQMRSEFQNDNLRFKEEMFNQSSSENSLIKSEETFDAKTILIIFAVIFSIWLFDLSVGLILVMRDIEGDYVEINHTTHVSFSDL